MSKKKNLVTILFSCLVTVISSLIIVYLGSFYSIESHVVANKFIKSDESPYIYSLPMVSQNSIGRNITLGRYTVLLNFTASNKDNVNVALGLGVDMEYYFMATNNSIADELCSIAGSSIPDTPLIMSISITLNINNRSTLELPSITNELIPWCQHHTRAWIQGMPGNLADISKKVKETIKKGLVNGVNVINVTYVVRARWLTSIDDVARALNVSTDVLRRDVNLTAVVIPSVTMEEYVKYRLVPATYVFLLAAISIVAMVAGYYVLLKQKKA